MVFGMDFERLRKDPQVAYLVGVVAGLAVGWSVAAMILRRPDSQPVLPAPTFPPGVPCADCARRRAEVAVRAVSNLPTREDRPWSATDPSPTFSAYAPRPTGGETDDDA